MKQFAQPILENDAHRLKNRLRYAESALENWKNKTESKHGEEHLNKNVAFFKKQVNNIKEKLEAI